MSSPFVAEIRMFGFNFPPTGWAFCNGQILPISQNTALFSLLGTTYGGDGRSTFALPNLQDSVPIGVGSGPGLSQRFEGEQGGVSTVTLLQTEIPAHTHLLSAYTGDPADTRKPSNTVTLGIPSPGNMYAPPQNPLAQMAPQAIGLTGGSLPHNNMMPYLTVNFCIALQGIFPPRS